MKQGFNGYAAWLGIDTHGHLMSYYRLLGLPEFETDSKTIEQASARQCALLEPHMAGEHREVASRIINEVLAAKRCLRDAKLKAVYDGKLRKLQGSIPTPQSQLAQGQTGLDKTRFEQSALPTADDFFATANGHGQPAGVATKERSAKRHTKPDEKDELLASDLSESVAKKDDLYSLSSTPAATVDKPIADGVVAKQTEAPLASQGKPRPNEETKVSPWAENLARLEPYRRQLAYGGSAVGLLLIAAFAVAGIRAAPKEVAALAIEPGIRIQLVAAPVAPLAFVVPPSQIVREHQAIVVTLRVGEADQSVQYALLGSSPPGMRIDSQGALHWTPREKDGGRTIVARVGAISAGRTAETQFSIEVQESNEIPALPAVPVQPAAPGQLVQFQLAATDANLPAQQLSYELVSGSAGVQLDARAGSLRFQVPRRQAASEYRFTVRASDGLSTSEPCLIVLNIKQPTSPPPTAAVANQPKPVTRLPTRSL